MTNRYLMPFLIAAGLAAIGTEASEIYAPDLAGLPSASVTILGEVHDNPQHHVNQAAAVAALAPKALVFEMLTEEQALRITPGALADQDRLGALLGWGESGWPDFAMYYPIFKAGEGAAVFGGAVPRDRVRRAVGEGAAAVFGGAAPLFGLDDALDDHVQTEREAGQMAAHCDALPIEMLPGMVEAQRLRDAGLAQAVIAALAETGGPVVVITGNGHARRDWGVPSLLQIARPDLDLLSVAQFESVPEGEVPFDHWLVTEPAPREDPCAVFGKD